jgi:two-component system, chemotaxis family, CheB/CheR fusion protein
MDPVRDLRKSLSARHVEPKLAGRVLTFWCSIGKNPVTLGGGNEALFAAIVDSSHDAIVSKDLNGIVTSWNPAAARIFGFSPEEMIGSSIMKIIPDGRHDEERFILNQIARGDRLEHYETVRQRKDGRLINISLTVSPIRADGVIVGASKIARDITERKAFEEAQRLLMREVNHRSKNLLAVVEAIIRQTAAKTRQRDFLRRLSERLQSLSISQDLLTASEWRGVDLRDLVTRQLHNLDVGGPDRIAVEGDSMTVTPAASQALSMAVHELLSNARNHGALSTETGHVDVSWKTEGASGSPPLFVMRWQERGGPQVRERRRKGFGTVILQRATAASLNADVRLDFTRDGLEWELRAPLGSALVAGPEASLVPDGR